MKKEITLDGNAVWKIIWRVLAIALFICAFYNIFHFIGACLCWLVSDSMDKEDRR